ncbi:MAG: alkaline phosphatase D family protein [Pseudobacteriovorax sp.]|nr:alkaline phosphatase D family protein [Pseudobacteriovorax sp.]
MKRNMGRRAFLKAGAILTPGTLTLAGPAYGWFWRQQERTAYERKGWPGYRFPNDTSRSIFSCGIASADPSPHGIVLWTRISPETFRDDAVLTFEISADPSFTNERRLLEGEVSREKLSPDHDYTVQVQLEDVLPSCATFYYRFKYRGSYSPMGRGRTLPASGQRMTELNLATASCQDYSNGFYGAYKHLANNDDIDFVVHLGDFIYETTGDTEFQEGALAERAYKLSSGGTVARDLKDYREIYRKYRSDINLQEAMAAHTWIMAPDDHETANDYFWDYETQTPVLPDHPVQSIENETQRLSASLALRLDSQKAWSEYVPSNTTMDTTSSDPFSNLKIYRSFAFGQFAHLMMIDTRSYRSAHPCGLGKLGERYLPKLGCDAYLDDDRTMLGTAQRDWLFGEISSHGTRWPIIGNQTFMGSLSLQTPSKAVPINVDAWDGFASERQQMAKVMQDQGHGNHIILTGDLHTYIASHLKVDYKKLSPLNMENHIGAEFMTSSVTSAGLNDQILTALKTDNQGLATGARYAVEGLVRTQNPHIKRFNSNDNGYSIIRFRESRTEWLAVRFDKDQKQPRAEIVHHLQKSYNLPWIRRAENSEVDTYHQSENDLNVSIYISRSSDRDCH